MAQNIKKYVGKFKDGKEHGQGTLTTPDGLTDVPVWKESIHFYFVD